LDFTKSRLFEEKEIFKAECKKHSETFISRLDNEEIRKLSKLHDGYKHIEKKLGRAAEGTGPQGARELKKILAEEAGLTLTPVPNPIPHDPILTSF